MKRPTEKDIETTANGYYSLECDGRHDFPFHRYLYYTKKEILKMWRENHPRYATDSTAATLQKIQNDYVPKLIKSDNKNTEMEQL